MVKYVVGIDLGQAADYTALSIIERVPQHGWGEKRVKVTRFGATQQVKVEGEIELPPKLYCRQLARIELGTKYPEIVSKTKAMLKTEELRGAVLVVDGTGVGRAVVDMFRAARLNPVAVHITSGNAIHRTNGYWYVPKRDLVAAAQVPLQDKRLLFANKSPLNETLILEMQNFKIKITEAANDTYGAWREGDNDDLIFSVMLASWAAQYFKPRQAPTSREY